MGEIADSIINGDFDYITGEYIGEGYGYPRSFHDKRNEGYSPQKPTNKANVCITNMCRSRGFNDQDKIRLVAKFLYGRGYKQLPKLSEQYRIIHSQLKNEFKKFLIEQSKD